MTEDTTKKKHKDSDTPKEAEDDLKPEVNEEVKESAEETSATETGKHETAHIEHAKNPAARCWQWLVAHKWVSIPLAVVLLLGVLAAIPFTRFGIAGLALKQNYQVKVMDSETQKPVSSAVVTINGQQAETNGEGLATVRTKVGYAELEVSKKYYHSSSSRIVVPIAKQKSAAEIALKADGRPVPVTILNSISGQPVANATITAEETGAKTDQDGKATIVLPADKKDVPITITGEGFNTAQATLTVTSDEIEANTFKITPSGKIYFLSNASGKIDVIKSNLDGTERQTVLAGTGKEDKLNTILLASRDWKYIALLSKRDGGEYAKLFLIETENGKVTVMDEGEATFNVYGWSGDRFVYTVDRQKVNYWEPKRFALKSYHAPGKKITTLAENAAEGNANNNAYEYFYGVYVLDQEVVFLKGWSGYPVEGKQATLNSIKADGNQKKVIKTYNAYSANTKIADFGEIYIQYETGTGSKVDEYHNGSVTETTLSSDEFYNNTYPYYSVSPSGKKTLWGDYRDGKTVFFIGDGNGENGTEIGTSEDFAVYGWFTDDYILLTKKSSQMHIMPAEGNFPGGVEKAPKISDYYKPRYNNQGFGYGYGG